MLVEGVHDAVSLLYFEYGVTVDGEFYLTARTKIFLCYQQYYDEYDDYYEEYAGFLSALISFDSQFYVADELIFPSRLPAYYKFHLYLAYKIPP